MVNNLDIYGCCRYSVCKLTFMYEQERYALFDRIYKLKSNLDNTLPILERELAFLVDLTGKPQPIGPRTIKLIFEHIDQVLSEAVDYANKREGF